MVISTVYKILLRYMYKMKEFRLSIQSAMRRCCRITLDSATKPSKNGFGSDKLSLYRKTQYYSKHPKKLHCSLHSFLSKSSCETRLLYGTFLELCKCFVMQNPPLCSIKHTPSYFAYYSIVTTKVGHTCTLATL
jgi:hypothetical protein